MLFIVQLIVALSLACSASDSTSGDAGGSYVPGQSTVAILD